MPPIISFIGWHDSGKTTIASEVVRLLKSRGHQVAVIKSSKETGIEFDTPGTDTFKHKEAGADSVLFVAPDQMVLQTNNDGYSLTTLAHRYFKDMDLVIGEGFKHAKQVSKIEVCRNEEQLLRDHVSRVIATVTDLENISGDYVFATDQTDKITSFIENKFLTGKTPAKETASLLVNGKKIILKEFVQKALSGAVTGFVQSLKLVGNIKEIELRITMNDKKE